MTAHPAVLSRVPVRYSRVRYGTPKNLDIFSALFRDCCAIPRRLEIKIEHYITLHYLTLSSIFILIPAGAGGCKTPLHLTFMENDCVLWSLLCCSFIHSASLGTIRSNGFMRVRIVSSFYCEPYLLFG